MVNRFSIRQPRQFIGKRQTLQQMVLQKLDIYIQKMSLDSNHAQYLKIISKWIKDLTIKGKTLKLSEENIEKNLQDIGYGNNLMEMTPKVHATKDKKFDFIKLKTLVQSESESERPSFIMARNIFKSYTWQEFNFQNIERTAKTQQ